ncbi:MAG: hypothetical protein Q8O29_07655 [Polaromonas sp.]|uniref:hypothetical protein n=1 Tax=Polaromonas sp. TaxID=1869339 RepID=UPI00273731B0|nr:hypothetical protein [Polaromonas sp.]MDP2818144.1 hypothetical protein [Polaromonas sp.]
MRADTLPGFENLRASLSEARRGEGSDGAKSRHASPTFAADPALAQTRNSLHGLTLETRVAALVADYG